MEGENHFLQAASDLHTHPHLKQNKKVEKEGECFAQGRAGSKGIGKELLTGLLTGTGSLLGTMEMNQITLCL